MERMTVLLFLLIVSSVLVCVNCCANGFIDLDRMTAKAPQVAQGLNGGLRTMLGNNELRIIADSTFNCTGELTSMIIGVEVRRADLLRSFYPKVQLWRPGEPGKLNRVASVDIVLTPDDFSPSGIYQFNFSSPLTVLKGDVLGIYQPQHTRSRVRVFYTDVEYPVLSFNDSGDSISSVNLSSFVSVRGTFVIFPFTNPPMCSSGFLEMETVLNISQDTQPAFRSSGFQRVFPSINFTCNGFITKWIVGAVDIIGGNFPELQVWRVIGSQFIKVGASSLSPNITSNTQIHVMYPSPAVQFQTGDVFGLFSPIDTDSTISVIFQRFNGPPNRLLLNINPPAPTSLPTSTSQFLFGENNYPLVSVEVAISPSMSILVSSVEEALSSMQSTATPTPAAPPTTIVLYVVSGVVSGFVVAILLLTLLVIIVTCICVRKERGKQESAAPVVQNSLRENPSYNTSQCSMDTAAAMDYDNEPFAGGATRVDSVVYETVCDTPASVHANPSYISSLACLM